MSGCTELHAMHRYKVHVAHGLQTAQIRIGGSHMAPEDDVGLYGRSVTFIPESPALPAPFR